MFNNDIGIDLGTTNTLFYIKKRGIILNEPTVVAIEKNKVLAVGKEALEMLGKEPKEISIVSPLQEGIMTDVDMTEIMLKEFIKKIKLKYSVVRPRVLISCPSTITKVDREKIKEVIERLGARKTYIEEEPKLAAIGAGLDITKPVANMVVDIGGGTTDIAVLSLNGVVKSISIKTASNTFEEDIIKYIKEKYKILIGTKTAKMLKEDFIDVYKYKEALTEIKGKNLVTGLPDKIKISKSDLKDSLERSINKIIEATINVLESIPPELSADIVEKGILLTGGGSLLNGLIDLFEERLKVRILIAENPLTCTIEGTGILLEELKYLEEDQ